MLFYVRLGIIGRARADVIVFNGSGATWDVVQVIHAQLHAWKQSFGPDMGARTSRAARCVRDMMRDAELP